VEVRFDDRQRDTRYGFRGLQEVVEARRLDQVIPAFEQVQSGVAAGKWAAGFVTYEAAPAFDDVLTVRSPAEGASDPAVPLLWFALYDHRVDLEPIHTGGYDLTSWEASEDRAAYGRSMAQIQSHIQAGDTYQVNYTYQLSAGFHGDPKAFYGDLLAAQSAAFGAYVDTGQVQILSASPELFFQQRGLHITCRPMKGTAARGRWLAEDRAVEAGLLASNKNRAENIMIVDLIRNDLGRVARFGTVRVDRLIEAERYETVWQLVSTVSAELRPSTSTIDVFRALFPCGSVTGAPKVRTMEIIAGLEGNPRGAYCGAIGMLAPPQADEPSTFSVAIRTVTIHSQSSTASYGVGGGVTNDSRTDEEYEETRTKALVILREAPDFELIETLRWESDKGYLFVRYHLDRLQDSAEYFGWRCDRVGVEQQLREAAGGIEEEVARVRLSLDKRGLARIEVSGLTQVAGRRRVAVDDVPVDRSDWRLFHKTSLRDVYQQARLRHAAADDVLMINGDGEITESTIANVIVRLDGNWVTPPVASGCLPGVMRRVLLEAGDISEAPVCVSDLDRAEGLALISSVRLRVPAVLAEPVVAPASTSRRPSRWRQ